MTSGDSILFEGLEGDLQYFQGSADAKYLESPQRGDDGQFDSEFVGMNLDYDSTHLRLRGALQLYDTDESTSTIGIQTSWKYNVNSVIQDIPLLTDFDKDLLTDHAGVEYEIIEREPDYGEILAFGNPEHRYGEDRAEFEPPMFEWIGKLLESPVWDVGHNIDMQKIDRITDMTHHPEKSINTFRYL